METSGAEPRIEEMARVIAGGCADPGRLEHARHVAEAQLDLIRIKEARRLLFESPEARRKKRSTREELRENMNILRWCEIILETPDHRLDQAPAAIMASESLQRVISARERPPPSLEEGIANLVPELFRLERYERRATSRRKVAMRAFDAYCAAQEKGGEGGPAAAEKSAKSHDKSDAD